MQLSCIMYDLVLKIHKVNTRYKNISLACFVCFVYLNVHCSNTWGRQGMLIVIIWEYEGMCNIRCVYLCSVFRNTSVLHLCYFKMLYLSLHEFLMVLLQFQRQSDVIFTLLTGETLLKISLIISLAFGNCYSERAKRFWTLT